MNNYELHERAQEMADTHSAYELARALVISRLPRDSIYIGSTKPATITGSVTVDGVTYPVGGPILSTTACDDQFAADPNGGE